MELRLLGPVELLMDGRPVGPARPQERLVLAVLARDVNRLVTADSLIDRVWDETPANGRRTLHVLVARLRTLLRDTDQASVETRSGGYVLHTDADRVDLHRFRQLVIHADQIDVADRLPLLRDALTLWRGEPLADLNGRWVTRMRDTWRQQYLKAVVSWGQAEAATGSPTAAIELFTDLTDEYPYVETLTAALMRALNAAGRSAEALTVYARIRQRLSEELGTDPGADLQDAHRTVLTEVTSSPAHARHSAQPEETSIAAGPPPIEMTPVLAAQLPPDQPTFRGRTAQMSKLDSLMSAEFQPTALTCVVTGQPGVGKTAPSLSGWRETPRQSGLACRV